MKLHLACGENRLEGWENHDSDLDLYKLPLPYADNSVDRIFMEHFGEHCTGPELLRLLDDCYRMLKPNGTLRLCCPVISPVSESAYLITRDHARDLVLGHGHKLLLNPSAMHSFLWCAGFDPEQIIWSNREPEDGHWKAIGKEKDDLETCRLMARK